MPSAWRFLLLAVAITWSLQLPAVLAHHGVLPGTAQSYMLPAALGGFGPIVAAVLLAKREGTLRTFFGQMRDWRAGAGWYLVALFVFTVIHVIGVAAHRVSGVSGAGQWLYPPENPQQIVAMFLMPLVEEPGWRGFALPRLQSRMGRLQASLVLGVVWALWHVMMFDLQGFTPLAFLIALVNVAAGSVVFSWLYNRTRGSLTIAIVAHAGVHLNNPTHALPSNPAAFSVYTLAICAAAVALVVFDRRAWISAPARS